MLFTILLSLSERTTSAGRGRFFHFKYKVKIQSNIRFFCGGAPAFFRHCDDPQGTAASQSLFLLSLRGSAGTAASQSLFLLSLRGSAGTAAIQSPAMYALDCFGGPPTAVSNVARGCYRAADAIVKEYGFMIILLVIKVPRKEDVMFATKK